MNRLSMLVLVVGLLPLSSFQQDKAVVGVDGHYAEGRNLEAYESAARHIRESGKYDMPEKWTKVENYTVAFEGEKDGCYVMHFVPHDDPNVPPHLDYNRTAGYPIRFYVRKSDLKVLHAILQ